MGLLQESRDVEWVICNECADGCSVHVERIFDAEGILAKAFCRCEERDDIIGRIWIPLECLVEWHTNAFNLARFVSVQLGITNPPIRLAADRIWRLGTIRYAGHRADVFLAIGPASDDFPLLWRQASTAVDQCSSPILLMPGELSATECIGHNVKIYSLTRLLYMENGQLMLDADEIRRAAGIVHFTSDSHDSRFVHNEDYTAVSLDDITYALTTNQAMVIKALHEAYMQKTHWLGKDYLLEIILDTTGRRLRDTFKSNLEAWKKLIVLGPRGRYRLNLPMG